MNLPKVITDLIKAQDHFDSVAYVDCFSETAMVFDEGKMHKGRLEIQQWIEEGNQKYRTVMKPIAYSDNGTTGVLSTEISGSFDGSPIILKFHFDIIDGQIQYLKITG